MFVDIYAIQNVPPCDINRDDTGTPKTAIYGGYLRSRVSSQAWKHAMREEFSKHVDGSQLGVRSKHAVALIADEIVKQRPELADLAESMATDVLKITGVKVEESKRKGQDQGTSVTQYLIFIARSEISKLAAIAIKAHDSGDDLTKPSKVLKKQVSSAFHGVQAMDIALFGRMLADAPDLNTDASAQVAHAISVDKISQEFDYFTAVDDIAAEDNAGAAMLDTIGFNSSTLYRYATVNLDTLEQQLGGADATSAATKAFLDAFVTAMPTGKQNTFANRTLPSAVLVALRKDQPVNGVAAFEEPVSAKEGTSISRQAEDKLAKTLVQISGAYGDAPAAAWWTAVDGGTEALQDFGAGCSFPEMLDQVEASVKNVLAGGEA